MPKLSQLFVKNLKPTSSDVWHWDDTLKGFAVRQRPGKEPQWWVRYAVNRKKRKHLIGPCSVVKAEKARERARDIIELARVGEDHNANQKAEREAPTIATLSERHLELQTPPKISEAYFRDKKTHWKEYIVKELGSIKVADLSREDVERFHSKFKKQPALANSLLATLSKALSDCMDFKPAWRSDNPCSRIKRFKVEKRQRILSQDEIVNVISRLEELKARGGSTWSVPWLIHLLLITGLRLRELANRQWKEIDLEKGTLLIPKPKGKKKERVVSLSSQAIEVLKAIPRKGPWVFPNSTGEGPFASPQKHWIDIRSKLSLDDVRVHDLRHTVASYAHHIGGLSQREVMELLGHSQMQTTERYLNVHDENKKRIADRASIAIITAKDSYEKRTPQNTSE